MFGRSIQALTEALGRDSNNGVEASHCSEVDGVERNLYDTGKKNSIHWYASRGDLAQQIRERQALVARESIHRS